MFYLIRFNTPLHTMDELEAYSCIKFHDTLDGIKSTFYDFSSFTGYRGRSPTGTEEMINSFSNWPLTQQCTPGSKF
uniref:Uncharacterized protein n=1 Tax=Magallana gigas TaxID=29159 RepID=K1R8G2_MAGGI